ncbi:hypothetical protein LTS17_006765 [Exophiala oligosperma]
MHPLADLSISEVTKARDVILSLHPGETIEFRQIGLQEPKKAALAEYLKVEHSNGDLSKVKPPPRLAKCHYDIFSMGAKPVEYHEIIVNVETSEVVEKIEISPSIQPSLTLGEFDMLLKICETAPEFKEALAELNLPDYMEVIVEPWPYGTPEVYDPPGRYFQGVVYAKDNRQNNPDSNFYPFPVPLIPVVDMTQRKLVKVIRLPRGGTEDGAVPNPAKVDKNPLAHCTTSEYVPELRPDGVRKDLKDLNVIQPDGPSFTVEDESLVSWQNWRFRVGFTPREGVVIHDVHYAGRSLFYRLSMSEMTVPYADPRDPFHRKQAFDFGEGGAGMCANNLGLGCDCLGHIKYFDSVMVNTQGNVVVQPNVICLHEQDNGIGWKHTNWRTGRAVVTRNRELVVHFILTLANYEYLFAYKFNLAGGIDIEVRATGIVSCVNIEPGKTSEYGNIVNPGVLAQNHQHIFAVRIDPAIDGPNNTVVQEESLPEIMNATTNPAGNGYKVVRTPITRSSWADASPLTNRIFKITNPSIKNPISGKPVSYKLTPPPTQLLLADTRSVQAKRAAFAQHHVWVSKYRDDELWANGPFPFQSTGEIGGVLDMVSRGENVENDDVVVWSVFGLTHNPRVEDWPVM